MLASSRAYASGARWKLMNPAPATSVRESRGLAGSAATMAAASSRGSRRAALASRSARLVVNSPCPLCQSPQRHGAHQLVSRQAFDVLLVLAGEAAEFAHRQVERREQTNLQGGGIEALERERYRILVGVLVQQPERVVELAVEVQQARGPVGVAIRDFQILRQCDAMRKGGIDVPGDPLPGIQVQRRAAGDVHLH